VRESSKGFGGAVLGRLPFTIRADNLIGVTLGIDVAVSFDNCDVLFRLFQTN
jgi:hypothetical protein